LRSSLACLALAGLLVAGSALAQEADVVAAHVRARSLQVDLPAGDVRVVGRDGDAGITLPPGDALLLTYVDDRAILTGAVPDGESITVYVPRDMPVSIELRNGAATVVGTYGDIKADIDVGALTIDGARGAFTGRVGVGTLSAAVFLNDASSFHVDEGDLSVSVLDHVAFPLTLAVGEGDIELTVADDYPALLDAQTGDGAVSTLARVEAEPVAQPESGRGTRVVGYLGGGGPIVHMRTERGDIRITPLAPDPGAQGQVVVAPHAPRGILVDGVFEAAWLDAPREFIGPDAEMRVMWDQRRFYIALIARETDWPSARHATTDHDDAGIDGDDAFDIAIAHDGHLYRITANMIGALLDGEALDEADDLEWESGTRVRHELAAGAWALEIGIPHVDLGWEVAEGARLGLNVSHVRPARGQWQDWAQDGGGVVFAPASPEAPHRLPVEILGDTGIPPHVFRRMTGVPTDGMLAPAHLPDIEDNLGRLDWYDGVFTGVSQDDGEDRVVIGIGEQTAAEVEDVRIMGASAIPSEEIERRYRWVAGWHSDATLEHRRTLTERAYHDAGFIHASVRVTRSGTHVVVTIDEGFIAGLVVEGAERVPEDEVRELLRFQVGAPYNVATHGEALETLIAKLSAKYRAFKAATEVGVQETRGVRLWVVRIEESPPLQLAWSPILNLTRVHGVEIGMGALTHRGSASRSHVLGKVSYLMRTRRRDGKDLRVNYLAAYIRHLTASRSAQVGVRWSRRTRSHRWQGDKSSFSFSTDFFSSEGPDVLLRAALGGRVALEAKVGYKADRSLERVLSHVDGANLDVLRNRAISDGSRTYGRLRLTVDARDTQVMGVENMAFVVARPSLQVRSGAWMQLEVESGVFEPQSLIVASKGRGDWPYSFAKLEARGYVSPATRHTLSARLIGQISPDSLPLQLQPWIGGAHRLRSRTSDYLTGDNGFLLSAEWRVALGGDVFLGPFVDIARAWYRNAWEFAKTETAIGGTIGIALPAEAFGGAPVAPELIRVDIAYPVAQGSPFGAPRSDRKVRIWARVDLPF
jgi:hypothetical protein